MVLELFVITAYAVGCDVKPNHPTKSGTQPVVGFTIAADPRVLPMGSIVHIDGWGERMVHDVGGKVKGKHIDVYVSDCKEAVKWGRRARLVKVVHMPKEKP